MKKLIACGLLLSTQLLFAQTLPAKEGRLVVRAIEDAVKAHPMNCEDKLISMTLKTYHLGLETLENGKVTIHEGQQPAVTIKSVAQGRETIANVTTNPEMTLVRKLEIKTFELTVQSRNVGTIVHPRYQEVIVKVPYEDIICE